MNTVSGKYLRTGRTADRLVDRDATTVTTPRPSGAPTPRGFFYEDVTPGILHDLPLDLQPKKRGASEPKDPPTPALKGVHMHRRNQYAEPSGPPGSLRMDRLDPLAFLKQNNCS